MNRTEPPKGTLDSQQPWYKGKVSDALWDRLKAKLTGGTDRAGIQYSSFVRISSADADRLIANMKKDPRGYPQVDQRGKDGGYYNLEAYQNWLVEEYLEGPFREETNRKIEQAAIESRVREITEQRKAQREKAQSFISPPSTLRPGKKISVKVNRMTGIIPKRPIPKEVADKISAPITQEQEGETVASPSKKVISSLGRLTLDLEVVNNNLDKITEVIQEDYAQTKAKNKKEIEDYRKRIANRERRLPKKDLGDDKRSLKEIIKPFVGGFFSGVGGAIRGLAAFNLLDGIINGDLTKVIGSLMGIGITFVPQIGMMIAGTILKSLLKGFGRAAFGRRGGMPMRGPRGRTPRMGGIGKFGAAMALGAGALSLGSAFMGSQETGDDNQDRLDELEAQEKALAAGGYAAITQDDLKRFQNLNQKFEKMIDEMMGKRSSSRGGGGTGSSDTEQTTGGQISGAPVEMNMETRGTVQGEYFDMKGRIELLKKVGATDEEAMRLAAIAKYESGGGSKAHNPDASTGDNSYGLWQVNMIGNLGTARRKQFNLSSNEDLFDPVTNAQAALAILRSQGWGAWTANTQVTEEDLKASRKAFESIQGGNESGGYTSKQKRVDISSTAPPSRGVLVSMIPTPTSSGSPGSVNLDGGSNDDFVDPNNSNDIIGQLYRTQWNIVDVG